MNKTAARFFYALAILAFVAAGIASAATEVGSFTAPLAVTLGGTGTATTPTDGQLLIGKTSTTGYALATLTGTTDQVSVANGSGTITLSTPQSINTTSSPTFANLTDSGLTAKSFIYSDANKILAATAAPTNGQLLIGSTGAVPIAAALTAGTGITVTNAAGSITLAANGLGTLTVVAKTANYGVLAGDSGTLFTNTAAGGSVTFTLPTAVVGQTFTFYVDAAQTLQVTAGASTTIRLGGSVSAAAGNITNATLGGCVTLVAVSTTSWVARNYTLTWTIT